MSAIVITGSENIERYRIVAIKSAIKLHMKCGIIPTRGVTITKLFGLATQITGNKYKRGQHALAIADLEKKLEG